MLLRRVCPLAGERGAGSTELVRLRAGGVEGVAAETDGRRAGLPPMGSSGSRLCLMRFSDEKWWRRSSGPDSLAVVLASSAES